MFITSTAWINSLISDDFNGDSNADIAAGSVTSGNISVLLGICNGSFSNAVSYSTPLPSYVQGVCSGDYDGGSNLNLIAVRYYNFSATKMASIHSGSSNATFSSAINFTLGGSPSSCATGDFNGDGKLNLVVTENTNNANVLVNCATASTLIVGMPNNAHMNKTTVNVYPNPSQGVFYIYSEKEARVDIYNQVARLVNSQLIEVGTNEVSLKKNVMGLFLVKVTTEKGSSFTKIVFH